MTTPNNQDRLLSDEELHDEITELRRQRGHHLMDEPEYTQKIIDLINTQKRLYAESVIGSRPLGIFNGSNDVEALKRIGAGDLWDEQRARIK